MNDNERSNDDKKICEDEAGDLDPRSEIRQGVKARSNEQCSSCGQLVI
jgi:hypothetical protein